MNRPTESQQYESSNNISLHCQMNGICTIFWEEPCARRSPFVMDFSSIVPQSLSNHSFYAPIHDSAWWSSQIFFEAAATLDLSAFPQYIFLPALGIRYWYPSFLYVTTFIQEKNTIIHVLNVMFDLQGVFYFKINYGANGGCTEFDSQVVVSIVVIQFLQSNL